MSSDARPPVRLREAFDTPAAKRRYVRRLFATIAGRYDLITRLLSFGQDQRWKRRLVELTAIRHQNLVLDLACGTGDIALLALGRGARVVGLDVTYSMLVLARAKRSTGAIRWIAGDMGGLPVADAVVDVVTTGYGLRNVPDLGRSLSEVYRVLRPGGRLCSLDFNRPESMLVRWIYLAYLSVVGGALGLLLHGDPDTYRYIPASIRRYPGATGVTAFMHSAGFRDVTHVRVLGGFMAIHVGMKPFH